MSVVPRCVVDLISGVDALNPALEEVDAFWRPDSAPLTVAMGAVGRAFAEIATELEPSTVALVFERLEVILVHGEEAEKNAAATGFLEAVANVFDRVPDRKEILQFAGKEAIAYLRAWDGFCGIPSD